MEVGWLVQCSAVQRTRDQFQNSEFYKEILASLKSTGFFSDIFQCCQDLTMEFTLKPLHQLSASQFRRTHSACPTLLLVNSFYNICMFLFYNRGLISVEAAKYCWEKNNNSNNVS